QDKMVGEKLHTMNLEWEKSNLEAADERSRRAREMARQMMARSDPNRVGFYDPGPVRRQIGVPLHFDKSCEFSNIEPYPVSYVGGQIIGFRKETILAAIPEMESMYNEAHSHRDTERSPNGYFSFHIHTGGQRRVGTRAVGTMREFLADDLDILFKEFDNLIDDIVKIKAGYEFLFEDNVSHVHFYFTVRYYPTPKCVSNWGNDIKPVEHLPFFDIFTASDDTDCVLQCSKRIWPVEKWGKEATEDTIDKIIARAGGKVCIVQPQFY
ncbi:hypothetical protein H4218_006306, partial [Coemansia sp. IMI 209128]